MCSSRPNCPRRPWWSYRESFHNFFKTSVYTVTSPYYSESSSSDYPAGSLYRNSLLKSTYYRWGGNANRFHTKLLWHRNELVTIALCHGVPVPLCYLVIDEYYYYMNAFIHLVMLSYRWTELRLLYWASKILCERRGFNWFILINVHGCFPLPLLYKPSQK